MQVFLQNLDRYDAIACTETLNDPLASNSLFLRCFLVVVATLINLVPIEPLALRISISGQTEKFVNRTRGIFLASKASNMVSDDLI